MSREHNPQAEQMGDESMARNLAHQAEAIWPQEQRLFDRYGLSGSLRILDLGCGTGEITRRLAQRYPQASLLGVDILEENLARARAAGDAGGRIRYAAGDAFALDSADAAFDLVVCRHMSQAVPDFPRVLAEIARVLRPGGWVHLLSEDYGMLHFPAWPRRGDGDGFDPDRFWNRNAIAFLEGIGCDGRVGRHTPTLLATGGFDDIAMDYVVVDTLRVPRATFAGIITAWRDGYAASLAGASGRDPAAVRADFDRMIAAIATPPAYAVWQVPVASARRAAARPATRPLASEAVIR
jgi:SAM-dependent methyltransferase